MLVYKVTNINNGKSYVGMTTRTIEKRWGEHVGNSKRGVSKLSYAIRKHGASNFNICQLEKCDTLQELKKCEMKWISDLGTYLNGYNMTSGGDGVFGYKHTLSFKTNLSQRMIGNVYGIGRVASIEARAKMSCAAAKIRIFKIQPVIQLDINEKIVAVYESMSLASHVTGISCAAISSACSKNKPRRGWIWKHATEDDIKLSITANIFINHHQHATAFMGNNGRRRGVILIDNFGVETKFVSVTSASAVTGLSCARISTCCHDVNKRSKMGIWKFDENTAILKNETICHPRMKQVAQCDLTGNILAIFPGIRDAAHKLFFVNENPAKTMISRACRKKCLTAMGFRWHFLCHE